MTTSYPESGSITKFSPHKSTKSNNLVLSALTTQPAEALGMQKSLGKIAPGYDANLVVVDGEYFDPKSKIVSVWIEGKEHYIASKKTPTFLGTWSLKYSGSSYDLIIEDPLKTQSAEKQKEFYKIPRRFGSIPVDELPLGCDHESQYQKLPRVP